MPIRRTIFLVLLIAVSFGAGMYFPANTIQVTVNRQDQEILGGTVVVSLLAPNRSPEEVAHAACGSKTELRNFEITHAIATTFEYRFDCIEPEKDVQ